MAMATMQAWNYHGSKFEAHCGQCRRVVSEEEEEEEDYKLWPVNKSDRS